jgi:hypothetical protein
MSGVNNITKDLLGEMLADVVENVEGEKNVENVEDEKNVDDVEVMEDVVAMDEDDDDDDDDDDGRRRGRRLYRTVRKIRE